MRKVKETGPRNKKGRFLLQCLSVVLSVALMVTMSGIMPGNNWQAQAADDLSMNTVQPILLVSGQGIIGGGTYTEGNISNERSYTLDELHGMTSLVESNYYSTINNAGTKKIYAGDGVGVEGLLAQSGYTVTTDSQISIGIVSFSASRQITGRNYYPNIGSGSNANSEPVGTILAWANSQAEQTGEEPVLPDEPNSLDSADLLTLMVGQQTVDEINNSMFYRGARNITVGTALTDPLISIDGIGYTRSDLLMMERADNDYTYSTKGSPKTDYVCGVPLAVLLESYPNDYIVEFTAADGWAVTASGMTVADLINCNYLLAYEKGTSADTMTGIYYSGTLTDSSTYEAYFDLYGEDAAGAGVSPAKKITNITISEPVVEASLFKHMTYYGDAELGTYFAPDAITSATVTVEGPGLESTTPVLMREMEETDDTNIWRGDYTDDGGLYTYEGVKVDALVQGLINPNIERVSDNIKVIFKNRWRQNVAEIEYSDLQNAATPVILAWGISDGTTTAPFVYNDSAILANATYADLGIGDGCLKLVYDKSDTALSGVSGPANFSSIAYVYVENIAGEPGYKHTTAADEAYNNSANTQYLVSFTGSALGREVNYTVKELEDMVVYDGDLPSSTGIGYRAEYGLSNTTYWYVNQYEGIKLWDLLTTKMGIDADTYKDDNSTLVKFASWDNYQTKAEFSMKQLADPDLFYYYEKSPLDSGTDRPTKEQLATAAYQPNNQVGVWEEDANGYPVKKGYPVLLAYGVNGYPYVKSSTMDGYAGGLGNDGGPMRVIFGKADGMNRSNPDDYTNYAYFYNNGSNQLQRVQEIYVGDDTRYNTHSENPAYLAMADNENALTVDVIQGDGTTATSAFTLRQLEDLLYGDTVTSIDRQNRQEKAYYFYKISGKGDKIQDLFEGVNLNYLLTEAVGMQGTLGTVSFYSGDVMQGESIPLADLATSGYNSENGTDGLGMMVAFAKNGYPLVANSTDSGHVDKDLVTGKTIKNSDGPLMLVKPQTEAEKTASTLGTMPTVKKLTKIVVNLEADAYAHIGTDYAAYAQQEVSFTGGVKDEGVTLKIGDMEKAQKYMVTDKYIVGGTENRYRGLDLYDFLFSSQVGASSLLSTVTVKNASGAEYILTAGDLTQGVNGKPVLLAYGIGSAAADAVPADGKPLVPDSSSAGYVESYANTGGPLRLLINNGTVADCIENVSEISVEVAEVEGWTHSFGVYQDYADIPGLRMSGSDISAATDFTIAELESLPAAYQTFGEYKVGNQIWVQGIDLWKLINDYVQLKPGATLTGITAYGFDGYPTTFTATQLQNGINGKPILVAYGMGTTSENGLPLVDGNDTTNIMPGYSSTAGNAFGPLRIIVNDNTGWCVKWLKNIVVGTGSYEPPQAAEYFALSGDYAAVPQSFTINQLVALGKSTAIYSYTAGGSSVTDSATGVLLKDVLEEAGAFKDYYIYNIKTTDNTSNSAYLNMTADNIESQAYFLAYQVNGEDILDLDDANAEAVFRIYRNFDSGTSWKNRLTSVVGIEVIDPLASKVVFSIDVDGDSVADLNRNDLNAINSPVATATFGSETVSGISLANLLASIGMSNQDSTITINDGAGAIDSLSDLPLADAADYFLAWKVGDDYIADDIAGTLYTLRLYKEDGTSFTGITGLTAVPAYNWLSHSLGSIAPASVRSIISDEAGGYWIGTTSGFFHYDSNGVVTQPYTQVNGKLQRDYVVDVVLDGEGGLWVSQGWSYQGGTNYGIVHLDSAGNATNYTNANTAGKLPHDYVQALEMDPHGNLWIGSFGGLTKYNVSTDTWQTWTVAEGLPALSVNTLVQDGSGGLWIGCYPNGQAGGTQPPFTGGYAYLSSADQLTAWNFNADVDTELNQYLLGDFWVRGIAVDANGGAWIVRSGAAPMYFNNEGYYNIDITECVGGRLDYISPDKSTVTHYTGRELVEAIDKGIIAPDAGAGIEGATPEIRVVSVDDQGNLWLGTSGLGIFQLTLPVQVKNHYTSQRFDWPSQFMDNVYYLSIIDDGTVLSGSYGGFAKASLSDLEDEEPIIIESFTISGVGTEDIAYYVGGTYDHTFKGLADSAGKVTSNYPYNGTTHYVKGALLSTVLADAGAGDKIKVTIKTSDSYPNPSYENIPYADLVAQKYFVAYDVGEGIDTLSKIADTDKNEVTASFRIYRNFDNGEAGSKDNRIKGVVGITVSPSGGGGVIPGDYDLTVSGAGVNQTTKYTVAQLKTAAAAQTVTESYSWLNSYGTTGSDTFKGVYLEDLLEDVVGLTSSARSVKVTARDGYYRSFNLDSAPLGINWTDIQGNQIMLAWERNGSPCDLQLVVGQTSANHVNKPMWVSDIVSITVSTSSTQSGSGTTGSYEGQTPTGVAGAAVQPKVTVSGDAASSSVTLDDINKALEEIKKQQSEGEADTPPVIEINMVSDAPAGQVKNTEVTLPADVVKALAKAGVAVKIQTDLGEMLLSPEVLQEMAAGNSEHFVITMNLTDDESLNDEAMNKVGDRTVYNIRLKKGNQEITDLNGNQIQISIPYKPDSSENTNNLLVYYINEQGEGTPLMSSWFDEEAGRMVFATVHLSLYAVGYNEVTFSDIQSHWAKDNIQFLAARGILKGKGDGLFDPNGKVTRAEFVTMLANLAGADVANASSAGFTDVIKGAWYENYVNWAVAMGIVSGYGDGRFGPDDQITREQMAVMLDKFIVAVKLEVQTINEAVSFTDNDKISKWAAAAVSKVQQYGIISGRTDGSFAPQDNANRAEAATVIKGCLELQ